VLRLGDVDMRCISVGERVNPGSVVFAARGLEWEFVREFDLKFFNDVYRGACGRCRSASIVGDVGTFEFVRRGTGRRH
jgi:hypothetical protein